MPTPQSGASGWKVPVATAAGCARAPADCTWAEFVLAWLAADRVAAAGVLGALEATAGWARARAAWAAGAPTTVVRRLLLAALAEALT